MSETNNLFRPNLLSDFVGQDEIVNKLKIYIYSAKERNETLDHTLFYGPPGVGKTSLAFIIAHEFNSKIKVVSAPTLKTIGDLVGILSILDPGDVLFVDEIQEKIDESEIKEIKSVREKYLDKGFLEEIINELEEYRDNEGSKYDDMHEYFKVFKDLKHITPDDPLGLNDALRYFWQTDEDEELYIIKHRQFEEYYKDKLYKFENILVYFVFRYFMKAVFDYDILAKIKTALVSYMIIRELAVVRYIENNEFTDEDMVDIAHTYSKDIEHLEENIEALAELFETNDVFDIEEMVMALMN